MLHYPQIQPSIQKQMKCIIAKLLIYLLWCDSIFTTAPGMWLGKLFHFKDTFNRQHSNEKNNLSVERQTASHLISADLYTQHGRQ